MRQHARADWQEAAEEPASPFDPKVLVLYGLLRSKRWIALCAGLGLLGGLLYAASLPNVYTASGLLYYRGGVQEAITEESLLGVTLDDQRMVAPGIADEIMLLDDPRIFEAVVEELGTAFVLDKPAPTAGDGATTSLPARAFHALQALLQSGGSEPRDDPEAVLWTAESLRARTQLVPVRGTSYIQVSHTAWSPSQAEEICRRLMDAFVARHLEVYGVEARLDQQRDKVDQAFQYFIERDAKYMEYRKTCGVYDYEAESERNRLALQELRSRLRAKETELEQLEVKIETISARLAELEPMIEQRSDAVVQQNPRYLQIQQWLDELRREELENEASVMAEAQRELSRKRIEKLRTSLSEELERIESTVQTQEPQVTRIVNREYYELEGMLVTLEVDRAGAAAAVTALLQDLRAEEEQRELIGSCHDGHFFHQGVVAAAKRDYAQQDEVLGMLQKLAAREQAGSANLKIHQAPREPLRKDGPQRLKPLLAVLAAGLFLGCALAVLRQLLDPRLRYPESVERVLGVKLLGVVPEVRRLRKLAKGSPAA